MTETEGNGELVRIGELSRRTDVPIASLRAWEARYGLLTPKRTKGGFRLYGPDDVARVLAMRANLERRLSAAEAARLALAESGSAASDPLLSIGRRDLPRALESFDENEAQAILDRLFGTLSLDAVLSEVVVPYLHELGDRWEGGDVSIVQEHFASNVIRGRLMALARGWGRGAGPLALLACVEGEQHDLPLVVFGLLLREHGWRIAYFGANTPLESLARAVGEMKPSAVIVSGTTKGALEPHRTGLDEIGRRADLYIAGSDASDDLAHEVGATYLDGNIFRAAGLVAVRHASKA
jgi:DNA-binding transcriptional MerR regulator/methylmalonyl-CoA mutase cobalamin-binding subunit